MTTPETDAGSATLVPPEQLPNLDQASLASALRPLWEDADWLAGRLTGRAFSSWEELIDESESVIATADEAERAALLSAHPRLGGDKAALKARSAESWGEQGGDRNPDADAAYRLAALNDRYEEKFGFPFVEWVRGRRLEDLIPVIESRLGRDRPTEIATGCAALTSIARDRLAKLATDQPPDPNHGKTP